jgi:Na+-transporting NADH:ubiquinone oxidoreductase subunit A
MHIKISKGFDINLAGKAAGKVSKAPQTELYAIKPADFVGLNRIKLLVEVGSQVKAGTPLFHDKANESINFVSPVSGEVVEIKRGEKRKVLEVKVLADKTLEYESYPKHTISTIANLKKEEIIETLCKSGLWLNIIQRPFGIVANPADSPRAIFISAFDSHPLAPDYELIFKGQQQYFQAGIDVLKKAGNCPIHITTNSKAEISSTFKDIRGVEMHTISGKHPAGNVGVQIAHISPINKGDILWTLNPYGVIQIGKLYLDGRYDASKIIALVGSEVKEPQYFETFIGANLSKLISENVKGDNYRVISGNPLTGERVEKDGFLGFYANQVSVLPEGNHARFFLSDGWLAPVKNRLSFHRAFGLLSFLNGSSKEYVLDTSLNGEERAFVATGVFEDVLPFDIFPMHLFKAIMAEDLELMEALGIYELIEEDVALCEFVDVSKHDLQALLRKGLDLIRLS